MSAQTIDYDALAKQAGAISSKPAPVDYAALAKQAGAVSSTAPAGGMDEQLRLMKEQTDHSDGAIYHAVKSAGGDLWDAAKGLYHVVADAPKSASDIPLTRMVHGYFNAVQDSIEKAKKSAAEGDMTGVMFHSAAAGLPLVGPLTEGVYDKARSGDTSGAIGTGISRIAQVASLAPEGSAIPNPAALVTKGVVKGVSAAADAVPSPRGVMAAAKNAPTIAKETVFPGAQGKVMTSAAELPLLAKSGVEDIFRSAAPTSMNKGFRENLNVAAPDLADIAHKVDVSESKGGIVNPDMRVRATVDAIRQHQAEMYKQERAPQIQRNANSPVSVGTNPNAVRGLEYLEATAGDVADSEIAKKALEEKTLTVEEADKLAQLANKTLRSYEKMTPEGKMQLQATNPKIGGIKALDSEMGFNLNKVLQSSGEVGLRDYERRYAALSVVRDQLESRMNATELKQEGMFGFAGRLTRPAVKLFTEGPSGVPSASQAAVADVNIGRSLQMGMSKLKASGISAKRATK